MTRTERIVGRLTARALVWLGVRAARRRDWHESNHCLAMLAVGASDHKDECGLPTDRPIQRRPAAVWEPYPTEPAPFRHDPPCDLTGCASAYPDQHPTGDTP